jgi:hypothetical protein
MSFCSSVSDLTGTFHAELFGIEAVLPLRHLQRAPLVRH